MCLIGEIDNTMIAPLQPIVTPADYAIREGRQLQMKNRFAFIAIAISCVMASVPATAATKVFLLAGQSNMAGEGTVADLAAEYASQPAVKFWSNSQWVNLQGGFGDGTSGKLFGPEIGFGYRLHQRFPTDDIYLVKYGLTSTNLAVQWKPDGTGPCYNTFKTTANAAIDNLTAAGKSPVVAGMIWMQGENDALDSTYAAAYAGNLTNFITTVRRDFSTPNMEFVVGRILPCYGTTTDSNLVRNAEMTVPGQVGKSSWINTDDLPLAFTGHYGTQGQIELGTRFANEFVQTPEPCSSIMCGSALLLTASYLWRRRRQVG